jgi:hypothetical protein
MPGEASAIATASEKHMNMKARVFSGFLVFIGV